MDNTWYYTLSTLAQTLASILGLAAVFVVLRLQSLTKNINDYKDRAIKILKIREEYNKSYQVPEKLGHILKDLADFSFNYKETRKDINLSNKMSSLAYQYEIVSHDDVDFIFNTLGNLGSFTSQRDDVMKMIKWPGVFMSLSIAYAIILLSLSDYIDNIHVLWFAVGFALFSFWSTLRASWKILDAIKRLE